LVLTSSALFSASRKDFTFWNETPPPNMKPFAPFDGLPPLNKVDQTMMRRLRKLADRRGRSVEGLIREALEQWVAKCEAEPELETKIVRFPKR
jgi:Ribbon-helix-helix protein, copG family